MLSILTVNIGAAAFPRGEALLQWLSGRSEDVFILTETSGGAGTAYLCEQFRRAGWYVVHEADESGDRGVALVSKIDAVPSSVNFEEISIPGRVVTATLKTDPEVTVVGTYVPSRDRSVGKTEKKQRFIESLLAGLAAVPEEVRGSMVLGGDYNVIARNHRPLYPGFLPFEFGLLEGLEELAFVDAHACLHPGLDVYSWIGRTGDGYRYDYFHVGSGLADLLTGSAYIHQTREQKLTDHAAVSLSVEVSSATRRQVSGLLEQDEQAALF